MNDHDNQSPPTSVSSSYGRKMIFVAWVALFTLLYVFFGEVLEDIYNPNQSPEIVAYPDGSSEVILQQSRNGHYLVTGKINSIPVNFMLDTGATDISVPLSIARKIGLHGDTPVRVQTANGIAVVYRTQLDKVSIGDIQLRNIRANINPNINSDEILLGMSFLKHLDFTQTGKQLTLRQNFLRLNQ